MKLNVASQKAIRYACLNFHYAKSVPANPYGYNIYNADNEWCGCVCFGRGATPNIASSFGMVQGEVIELVRVALNGKQECTSQAVAMALKQLHKDVPLIHLVVSYADIDQDHLGTIYQATNWIYVGDVNQNSRTAFIINGEKIHPKTIYNRIINGKHCPQTIDAVKKYFDSNATVFISKGKRKYIMPLDKRTRKQFAHLAQPYPKTDADWHKIDRNQFKKA